MLSSRLNKPISVLSDSSIAQSIEKLKEFNISRLILQKNGKPVGIVSEKDVCSFLLHDRSTMGLDQISVSKISKDIIYAQPSISMEGAAKIMIDEKIGSLVTGSNENASGIVTKTDLVRYFTENYTAMVKVADMKNPSFVYVHTDSPLFEVIQKMADNKISRVIVCDRKNNTPIGIISFRDFFDIALELGSEDITESSIPSGASRLGFLSEQSFGSSTIAKDIMTPHIVCVKSDDGLVQAGKIMLENGVNGVAVTDEEGNVGMVSKTDVVRYLALQQ